MADIDRTFIIDLAHSLGSIKADLEMFARNRPELFETSEKYDVMNALIDLESIRIPLRLSQRKKRQHQQALERAYSDLEELLRSEPFRAIAEVAIVRLRGGLHRRLVDETGVPSSERIQTTALGGLELLREVIRVTLGVRPIDYDTEVELQRLKHIIPEQKLAPVTFAINNNKIIIVRSNATIHPEDALNIEQARATLLQNSERAIAELSNSNCDRRLLESVGALHMALSSTENIVHLGILNIGCESMHANFKNELPTAIDAMLMGITAGVAMYVAQFPEWQKFAENAAKLAISAADVETIASTASDLENRLRAAPDLADPEVPRTIAALRSLISNPMTASNRAALAMLRTLENLIAKVFQYGVDIFEKTANKISNDLPGAVSKVVIGGLLAIALSGAVKLSGISTSVGESSWMKTAADIVKSQIERLSKAE